jgi:hypothetical protein
MTDSLYVTDGDTFTPTELVTSPWSRDTAHGGPPAGLLTRAFERVEPVTMHLVRITLEILRPIPMVPVRITTEVVRPGRKVQLLAATLSDSDGSILMKASAWRIRDRAALDLPPGEDATVPFPLPDELEPGTYRMQEWTHFPIDAQEYRTAAGSFADPGRVAIWLRLLVPIVAGETPTPEQLFAVSADSANGMSRHTDTGDLLFINPDLTVYFMRRPRGEWVGMDAVSHWDPSGRGLSDTTLYDRHGYVGRTNQSLFIDEH